MASVLNLPNGRRAVQFFAPDGERRTVRLGKLSKEAAAECARAIDALVDAKSAGQQAPRKALEWVKDLSNDLADRLAKFEVIPPRRKAAVVGLQQFLDEYIGKRTDVKGGTATFYGHTSRCLVEFFGADRPLEEITPGDVDEWRLWLADHEKLADNTVRRRCGMAKQFFRAAVRKRLISENPFEGMKGCLVKENRDRDYFITIQEAAAVLNACPNWQWRLLFALSRFGGLRCPSEHMALRWADVDLPGGKMLVRSPKTEHHDGKESRLVPIFPELRPYLEEAWDRAEPGEEFVIPGRHHRIEGNPTNLGTQLTRIIIRAGLKPWPKLWQNLRSTRETELCETNPEHVVCSWIGNSQAVAKKHYLQVTAEHFQKASESSATEKALQKAMHQQAISSPNDNQQKRENPGKHGIPDDSGVPLVGVTGLEPVTSTV